MASSSGTTEKPTAAPASGGGGSGGGAPAPEPAKLAEDFVPNEPADAVKSGTNEKGERDDTLGDHQAERAITEALLSLRPQPSAVEIKSVLDKLAEVDPKTKQPLKKFKTADEAGKAGVEELNKQRAG